MSQEPAGQGPATSGQDGVAPAAAATAVLIYGSCVSRDLFNLPEAQGYRLVDYYARSSVASAFGSAPVADSYSRRIASTFQRRQVARDLGKSLRDTVLTLSYDVLLLDFIDERFSLLRLADGRLVTLSAELGGSGIGADLAAERLAPFSEPHFQAWESGWRNLVATLDGGGRLDRVRLNCARWCDTTASGGGFGDLASPEAIHNANRYLERLYARAAQDLGEHQLLCLAPPCFVSSEQHAWGTAPFHYTDETYRAIIAELNRSCLGTP
jgi:hypothetical protein